MGTPLPLMRNVVPDWMPSGTFRTCSPSRVGTADLRAQGGLRKRHRNHTVQIVALALEEGMLFYVQNHIEIAGRTAVKTAFSVSGEANAGAIFHAGGNLCVHRALPQNPAFAFAFRTGVGNDTARALAGGTGTRNTEKTLLVADLAAAVAGTAGDRRLARSGARTSALFAGLVAPHRDLGPRCRRRRLRIPC